MVTTEMDSFAYNIQSPSSEVPTLVKLGFIVNTAGVKINFKFSTNPFKARNDNTRLPIMVELEKYVPM